MTYQSYADRFFAAYIECSLWASFDQSTPQGGEPLDRNFDPTDIEPDSLATMRADCERFLREQGSLLEAVDRDFDTDAEQHGHDFWLSRNGHGAGFFDRGYGEASALLQVEARCYGESDLSVSDEGTLYIYPSTPADPARHA